MAPLLLRPETEMNLRYVLGVFALGSLVVACMVPDVTKKSDLCANNTCAAAADSPSESSSGGGTSSLSATTGAALPAGQSTPAATAAKHDAGAVTTQSGTSSSSGGGETFTPDPTADAGTTSVTADAPSCDKLLDCCVALRSAGKSSDADTCDNTWLQNDDLSCYLAQDTYANPTDGTVGTCDQP